MEKNTVKCGACQGAGAQGTFCFAPESPRYMRFVRPQETCTEARPAEQTTNMWGKPNAQNS